MKSGHNQTKRHRGSSPPFREAEQGFHDWLKSLKSIDQNSDNTSETQVHKQQRYKKGKSANQKFGSSQTKDAHADQKSSDKVKTQRDKNDETRWQDDGGEGG